MWCKLSLSFLQLYVWYRTLAAESSRCFLCNVYAPYHSFIQCTQLEKVQFRKIEWILCAKWNRLKSIQPRSYSIVPWRFGGACFAVVWHRVSEHGANITITKNKPFRVSLIVESIAKVSHRWLSIVFHFGRLFHIRLHHIQKLMQESKRKIIKMNVNRIFRRHSCRFYMPPSTRFDCVSIHYLWSSLC